MDVPEVVKRLGSGSGGVVMWLSVADRWGALGGNSFVLDDLVVFVHSKTAQYNQWQFGYECGFENVATLCSRINGPVNHDALRLAGPVLTVVNRDEFRMLVQERLRRDSGLLDRVCFENGRVFIDGMTRAEFARQHCIQAEPDSCCVGSWIVSWMG